jgi:ABC-2 type transport system permease protein
MRFQRIKAIVRKESIQIARDPFSLAMGFLMPLMLLFIFGYAISLDVDELTTVVNDLDKTSASRELVKQFTASGYFKIVKQVDRYQDIDYYLDSGRARVAIAIPVDFLSKAVTHKGARFQIIVDGSDSNTATIALGYASGIAEQAIRRFAGVSVAPVIDVRARVWYNPELKSKNFIIPGLVAVIMAVVGALLTSLTVAREWERGTMEQLISSPVKVPELIIGKLLPYFVIGLIDVLFSAGLGVFLFEVPLKGSLIALVVVSSIFLFGVLSLGILVSILAKSQVLACQVAIIASYLPAFLLSGFMFAIPNMPKALQILSYVVPARYFVGMLKDIFLKGNPISFFLFDAALLLGFGTLLFALANVKLKKVME